MRSHGLNNWLSLLWGKPQPKLGTKNMADENKSGLSSLPDHPLLTAFRDMAKVATTQRGLKALARIEHGINNRQRWIDARQSQINRLTELSSMVLDAYDRGDDDAMRGIMMEVDHIVNMSEGSSAAENRVEEVFEAEEVESDEHSTMKRASKRAFKHPRGGY